MRGSRPPVHRAASILMATALALACGGLMGYGAEVSMTPVLPGQSFTATYAPATAEPHELWLTWDVSHTQPYRITGPIEVKANGQVVSTWQVDLTSQGSAVQGGSGRYDLGSKSVTINGEGSASSTTWLAEIPGQPVGTTVEITGTLSADAGTTVNALELVVTESQ